MAEFTRPSGARTDWVAAKSVAANASGLCPFCVLVAGQDSDHELIPIPSDRWVATRNLLPQRGTDHALLVISRVHVSSLA